MFQSLDIEGFRGFKKLQLSDLGRVNLIVGNNGTGKTSLLESIALRVNHSIASNLPGLLRANMGDAEAAMVDACAEVIRTPEDERQMVSLLASVDPRIRSVSIEAAASKPVILVDVGFHERIPLSRAGQGIYRLVAIFSELFGHKPAIYLIDEIDNSIHYSALPILWKGIAEASVRFGIQVFATSHSRECLVAAHECFAERDTYVFRVIQLYRTGDALDGRTLDHTHIGAAIDANIELR